MDILSDCPAGEEQVKAVVRSFKVHLIDTAVADGTFDSKYSREIMAYEYMGYFSGVDRTDFDSVVSRLKFIVFCMEFSKLLVEMGPFVSPIYCTKNSLYLLMNKRFVNDIRSKYRLDFHFQFSSRDMDED
jgi:hypothetical protein